MGKYTITHEYSNAPGRPTFLENWIATHRLIFDNRLVEFKKEFMAKMTESERKEFLQQAQEQGLIE